MEIIKNSSPLRNFMTTITKNPQEKIA